MSKGQSKQCGSPLDPRLFLSLPLPSLAQVLKSSHLCFSIYPVLMCCLGGHMIVLPSSHQRTKKALRAEQAKV